MAFKLHYILIKDLKTIVPPIIFLKKLKKQPNYIINNNKPYITIRHSGCTH